MEKIRPMLFTTLKKYSGAQLMSDVIAGIIVAIIALPLSIALALASGVGPEQGIYTAIAAGFVISFLGGSQVQIAGPTAAFATIVAGIVAKSGVEGLAVATILFTDRNTRFFYIDNDISCNLINDRHISSSYET